MTLDRRFEEALPRMLLSMRLVVLSLVMGAAALLFVLLSAFGAQPPAADRPPLVSWVAVLTAMAAVVARATVPPLFLASQRRALLRNLLADQDATSGARPTAELVDPERLWQMSLATLLVGAAPFEGASVLASLAYALEQPPWTLLLALALMAGIAAHFPTWGRTLRWGAQQLTELDRVRHDEFDR